jgi:hypothetical protein
MMLKKLRDLRFVTGGCFRKMNEGIIKSEICQQLAHSSVVVNAKGQQPKVFVSPAL